MRLSEQFKLRWPDVDLERGLITLPETKYVRLNEEAKEILRTWQIQQMNRNLVSRFVYPSETLVTPIDQRNSMPVSFGRLSRRSTWKMWAGIASGIHLPHG